MGEARFSYSSGPPEEASRYLRNKDLMPSFAWEDVDPEEHALAFTVAKATQIDVLVAIRESVQRALDEGQPFSEFKRELTPVLQRKGWWGTEQEVVDTDGTVTEATLGTPRRLRVIYDTNMRTARAAGQWDRIQRTKEALPYLAYRLGPSERHRPHHKSKEWLVLRADDPFWMTWFPPNGWGCKCWVMQISQEEAERLGVDEAPEIVTSEWVNPRTGEVRGIPNGIDPGWEVNPGAVRLAHISRHLVEKVEGLDRDMQRKVTSDIVGSSFMEARMRLARDEKGAAGKDRSIQLSGHTLPIAEVPFDLRDTLGTDRQVLQIASGGLAKIGLGHPEITRRDFVRIQDHLDGGEAYWDERSVTVLARDPDNEARNLVLGLKSDPDTGDVFLATMFVPSRNYADGIRARRKRIR